MKIKLYGVSLKSIYMHGKDEKITLIFRKEMKFPNFKL